MPWIRCRTCGRTVRPLILAAPEGGTYAFTVHCPDCGATSLPHASAREALEAVGEIRRGGEDDFGRFIPRDHEDVDLRPLSDDGGWRR